MPGRTRQRIMPAWQAMISDTFHLAGSVVQSADPEVAARLPQHVGAMASDVRDLAGALAYTGERMARLVPGYTLATNQLRKAEAALLKEVKLRLDNAAMAELGGRGASISAETGESSARTRVLHDLLRASLDADAERSLENLHMRILRSMVPDEARILAALADGTPYPLIHVETRGTGPTRTVLANASTVGRVAGIRLNAMVPLYVTHMRLLGVVEEGPADDRMTDQYLLLASESYVRRATTEAGGGRLGARTVRRTLRISTLGAELWAACRPDEPRILNGSDELAPTYRSAYAGPALERRPPDTADVSTKAPGAPGTSP